MIFVDDFEDLGVFDNFHILDNFDDFIDFDDFHDIHRGKSLLELSVTTFLPDWQRPIIFVRIISNFLCMCSNRMASADVILK